MEKKSAKPFLLERIHIGNDILYLWKPRNDGWHPWLVFSTNEWVEVDDNCQKAYFLTDPNQHPCAANDGESGGIFSAKFDRSWEELTYEEVFLLLL